MSQGKRSGSFPAPVGMGRRPYRGWHRLLSLLLATWCGLSLALLGIILAVGAGHGIYNAVLETAVLGTKGIPELVGALTVDAVLVFVALLFGVAFGRFLLRTLPPRLSGARRPAAFLVVGALAVVTLALPVFLSVVVLLPSTDLPPAARPKLIVLTWLRFGVLSVVWLSGAVGPLLLRHVTPRAFLDRPFVLFLRRFSAFSDRAVISLVLKQAPPWTPIVFLTPTRSQPSDWSPLLVGFAGMKVRYPLASAPIVLCANDTDWQRTAEELIARAETILIDTSEGSGSMTTEVELIGRAGRWPDTICLRQAGRGATPDTDAMQFPLDVRVIAYVKSWARAIPRMALGLVVMVFSFGGFVFFLPGMLAASLAPWATVPLFVLGGLVAVAVYVALFAVPSIDGRASKRLQRLLQRTA